MISSFQKHILLLLLTLTCHVSGNSIYKNQIYNAYINSDYKKWESIIIAFEKQKPTDINQKLELVSYQYGYISYLLKLKSYESATLYIDKGDKLIAEIIKTTPKCATAYAFKGAFTGFKISMNKLKVFTLSAESNRQLDKSLEMEPLNIQAFVDKANILYHTPRLFGGDKEQSLKLFIKAIALMEKNNLTDHNWLYLNTLTLTARNYESLNQLQKAKSMYEKVLQIAPDFKRVKNELYPTLLKQIK